MRQDLPRIIIALTTAFGLYILYFAFISRYAPLANWSSLTEIEQVMLGTMILRLIIVLAVEARTNLPTPVVNIVFALEAFLILPLLLLFIVTGVEFYATLMGTILTTWFGTSALFVSPYFVYKLARSLARGSPLVDAMMLGGLEVAILLFFATLFYGYSSTISGLTNLGTVMISQVGVRLTNGGLPNPAGDSLSAIGVVLFFIGMVCYFTIGSRPPGEKINLIYSVALPMVGTLLAVFWTLGFLQLLTGILFVLTLPTIILVEAVWWTARGK
jgi:hypothetical protein